MWQTCHQQLPFKDFQGILEKNNDMVMEWGWFMAGLPHHDCRCRYGYIYIDGWIDVGICRWMMIYICWNWVLLVLGRFGRKWMHCRWNKGLHKRFGMDDWWGFRCVNQGFWARLTGCSRTMYGLGLCLGLCLTINTGAHCFVWGGTETLMTDA